jgi:multisubunit Na+/H+ antiporter MnhE subunit
MKAKPNGEAFRRPMRWLLIVLLVSVCALVAASAGVAWHIWRQHRKPSPAGGALFKTSVHEESDMESEEHL